MKQNMVYTVYAKPDLFALILKFLSNRRQNVQNILAIVNQEDFESVRKLGHGFKGSGASNGFEPIRIIGCEIK